MKMIILLSLLFPLIAQCVDNPRTLQLRYLDQSSRIFRIVVFADLLYGKDAALNQKTQAFQYQVLSYYNNTSTVTGIDLVVVLGNAVDG